MFDLTSLELAAFAGLGGFVGFFAFSNKPTLTPSERISGVFTSLSIAAILALPIHTWLIEKGYCSKQMADMLVGVIGLGGPDIVKTYFPKLQYIAIKWGLRKFNIKEGGKNIR